MVADGGGSSLAKAGEFAAHSSVVHAVAAAAHILRATAGGAVGTAIEQLARLARRFGRFGAASLGVIRAGHLTVRACTVTVAFAACAGQATKLYALEGMVLRTSAVAIDAGDSRRAALRATADRESIDTGREALPIFATHGRRTTVVAARDLVRKAGAGPACLAESVCWAAGAFT